MTIQPFVFDLLFYSIILLGGLDFAWSGLLVLRENIKALEKPKLLGLTIIKIMHISDTSKKQNKLTSLMFTPKYMGFYTFLGGVLLILASLIMLFDILLS